MQCVLRKPVPVWCYVYFGVFQKFYLYMYSWVLWYQVRKWDRCLLRKALLSGHVWSQRKRQVQVSFSFFKKKKGITYVSTSNYHETHLSAGAVEYTDCISAERKDPSPNECPGYDIKQSDGGVPVLELWGKMWSTPSLPLLPSPH